MRSATDILTTPAIRAHTARVLALQEKERQARSNLASIIADIGDELISTKSALDRTSNKTAWLTWLSDHIDFDRRTATNYMEVGRLRKKMGKRFPILSRVTPSALYKIAALPDPLLEKLAADPRLPSIKTGALTPIDKMSARDLILAIEILRGRRRQPKLPNGSRNQRARQTIEEGKSLMDEINDVNAGTGSLDPQTKREMLDYIEELRTAVLHWKAWVTPEKGKRLA